MSFPPPADPWPAPPWTGPAWPPPAHLAQPWPTAPRRTGAVGLGLSAPWSTRLWPADTPSAARPTVIAAALAVGTLGAVTLRPDAPGSACAVTGAGILAVGLLGTLGRGRRPTLADLLLAALAIALLGVGALRAAPWLAALGMLGAFGVGTLALVGARTWTGVALSPLATGLAPVRAGRWASRTALAVASPRPAATRLVLGVTAISAALLAVFGALFAAADPAFAALADAAFPSWEAHTALGRIVVAAAVTLGALTAAFVGFRPPAVDVLAPAAGRAAPRWAWAVPLALLDALFSAFVLVQLTVLFGGREHVARTQGLTFAEYARQGFGQLLVVTVLTLAVVAAAVRFAPRRTAGERAAVRLLLGALCLLALVIVASAVHRMWLYEQEFGFTRLRLLATTIELGLGAVLVLVLAAGIRLRDGWLPRSVAGLAAVTILALAAVNPDAHIAEHNVTRYEQTGRVDVAYLATLSGDAVPALLRLPPELRDCALRRLAPALASTRDPWFDTNLGRARARELLAAAPPGRCRGGAR